MKLCIYTAATKGYGHALTAQARRVIAGLNLEDRTRDVLIVLVTDDAAVVEPAREIYESSGYLVDVIARPFTRTGANYKTEAQLMIAAMRTAGTHRATAWDADLCLALDSDVLPPANAIRCMIDMLAFDGGYYGVSFCPYPSQGGGAFLGGRGTPQNPILPDFFEDEKDIPEESLARRDEIRELLKDPDADKALREELEELDKQIRALPPRENVFACNAKKWRRRGWFDSAYPAIGKGSIVPTDWTGFGCTMMGREALSLCDWTGYEGRGTEDLYINFRKWHPAGIRMACIPHCPCDHVIRDPKDATKHILIATGHADDPEHVGHLRQWRLEWHTNDTPALQTGAKKTKPLAKP